ncbi:hypothetical protein O181_056507 [Austropuccinia psidii MF-1]|uniref:Uncharacterized protein n=1 Tax=Austropuccinia psidii MF-1 TaxID=1389203 RepID=A0A9Q3HUI0_9BASI|nr:hypothetical protein [Austropuccinia psidii MF-1]
MSKIQPALSSVPYHPPYLGSADSEYKCTRTFSIESKTDLYCRESGRMGVKCLIANCFAGEEEKDLSTLVFKNCKPKSLTSDGPALAAIHPTNYYVHKLLNTIIIREGYYFEKGTNGSVRADLTERYKCRIHEDTVWPTCHDCV